MGQILTEDIKSSNVFNVGGITQIWLLDMRNFEGYLFSNDDLYSVSYVEAIAKRKPFLYLGHVNESSFTESYSNGYYSQQLNSFIHTVEALKTADLQIARSGKFIVVFVTTQCKAYTFGGDNGVSFLFNQTSGQTGETSGYSIQLKAVSNYPLFEVNPDVLKTKVLGSEKGLYITTQHSNNSTENYIIEIL